MSTGVQSLSIGLTAFTTGLDGLRPDQNPDDLSNVLRAAFKQRELYNAYTSSLVEDTERTKALLEVFDKALQAATRNDTMFKRFRQLCGWTGLLPTSHIIPGEFIQTTEHPVSHGAFGDVWEGIYNDERVAIKSLRVYKGDDVQKVRKIFCKEVVIWRRISHLNVIPFLGVSEAPALLSMVSEWMSNGNVRDYVGKNPEISRLQLLLDVSRGLSFLHSLEIVHGDLKGDNILVDKSGYARLGDFGLTSIAGINCTETSASRFKGSHRWMAPELFNIGTEGISGLSTYESDVFALGMVTFEVFTGQVPFPDNKQPVVMKNITEGRRPSRPPGGKKLGLSDELWEIIRSSLAQEAKERPPISTFVNFLEKANPSVALFEALAQFNAYSERDIQRLRRIFEYGNNTLLGMREDETLAVIDVFDQVLNSSLDDRTLRNQCSYGLQKIAARCGLLPKSYWIAHARLAEYNSASSSTVRVSSTRRWLMEGKLVAVKAIGPDCVDDFNPFKHRLCTHAVMWKRLRHQNVVRFLGLSSNHPPFSLVYHWMSNGNLFEYLRDHPGVGKFGLLLDVAHGLAYLHQCNLVHGNLTGDNILVDGSGVACISEYGLEIVLRGKPSPKSIRTDIRWMASELLGTMNERIQSDGKVADIYSFTMIVFEVLSGTTPFPNESDEEIVDELATGSRPERPSNDPSQRLVDELWEQIVTSWNQEPNGRPTVFKILRTLRVLDEPQHQSIVSKEDFSDEMGMRDWEFVKDDPEEMLPSHEERREHCNSDDPSGSTLTPPSPLPGPVLSLQSESGTHKSDRPRRGIRTKAVKYMRSIFNLPKHVTAATTTTTTTAETVGRCEPLVGNPVLRIEIIDQSEKEVIVRDGCVPYVVSRPIPEGKALRKVIITVVSKDQGWSDHLDDYGTYRNSWTWFELSVGPPSEDSREKWRGLVVRNLHAHGDFKEHTIEITDGELYEKAESGDVLTVWALAKFEGWRNTVKKVVIRYVVE